jgi:hypothetical protein
MSGPTMQRLPQPEGPVPPGHHWEVVQDGNVLDWRVGGEGKRCRFTVGPNHQTCKRPAVVRMKRGSRWWGYCDLPGHMYAYWIEDGKIAHWTLRRDH